MTEIARLRDEFDRVQAIPETDAVKRADRFAYAAAVAEEAAEEMKGRYRSHVLRGAASILRKFQPKGVVK